MIVFLICEEKYINAKTLILGLYEIFHKYLFY